MAGRGSHHGSRGRGRGRSDNPDIQLSKSLSWLLRHGAEKEGLQMQEGGFLFVSEILQKPQFKRFSPDDVQRVVLNNEKQRFYMEEHPETGKLRIRANQGHTIQVEVELTPITDPDQFSVVVHGTYTKNWQSIKAQGLDRMKRNHIHLAPGEPGESGVISGMRGSCDILIFVNLPLALSDGLKFYLSANNVILTPGDDRGSILPKYFQKVVERRTGKELDISS